jgi:hypothetical protein|uniref:Uncharacterized protein n=1 Tax=Fagus sylvatica TaxID=28930 RepID=A0A2N9EHW7_FAGSY
MSCEDDDLKGLFGWSLHIQSMSEVLEPPESSSLYLDQSANMAAQQVEPEDEIEEPKEIEQPLTA